MLESWLTAENSKYFYGVLPNTKYICIYDTLLEKSTPDEVEAILAHELGHWVHSDPLKLLVLSQVQIVTILSLFTLFIHNASLFRAFGFQYIPSNEAAKIVSKVKYMAGLGSVAPVQVSYLPIVIGLELFQMVFHPLDSVGECLERKLRIRFASNSPLYLILQSNSELMLLSGAWSTPQTSE